MIDLDHDIRVWLSRDQYLGLKRLAAEDERSLSAYVRRLITRALDESMDPLEDVAMPAKRRRRDVAGR